MSSASSVPRLTYDEEPIAQCPDTELDKTLLPANLIGESPASVRSARSTVR